MTNADQTEFWSGDAGQIWVEEQAQMDALLAPVLDLVLDRAHLQPGEAVLDIGCGAGASTGRALAAVGSGGRALGVDVSPPLLAQARATQSAQFLEADAQIHGFEPTAFDAMISRFGVMFFEDTAAAFANMARALKPGGRMVCAAWGAAPENPFFMVPAAAARSVFGPMPKVDRSLPGPFAFENADRTLALLRAAGLKNAACDTVRLHLPFPSAAKLARLSMRIGPAQSAMRQMEGSSQQAALLERAITQGFAAMETEGQVQVPAVINLYTATV